MDENQLIPLEDLEIIKNELGLKAEEEYIDRDGNIYIVIGVRRGKHDGRGEIVTLVDLHGPWGKCTEPISSFLPDSFFSRKLIRLPGGYEKAVKDNQGLIDNPSSADPDKGESSSREIVSSNVSRAQMMQAATGFQIVADKAMMMERILKRKADEIWQVTVKMRRRLEYLNSVIRMIEAYLGVYEQIEKIKDGEPGLFCEPIHIMQTILWMDEEVGDVEYRRGGQIGIDFNNIQVFDQWLVSDGNWRNILPYEKCIVGIKPSRQFREYGNPFANVEAKQLNDVVYLLIRNGEIFYRIETGLVYGDVLFPKMDEWRKIVEAMASAEERDDEHDVMRKKSDMIDWQSRVALLQGLVDRTAVMDPKPLGLDLFGEDDYESGRVVLHRDMETMALPDGWDNYRVWQKKLNGQTKRGSRILLADIGWRSSWAREEEWVRRFDDRFQGKNHPPLPESGVYKVEKVIQKKRWYASGGSETYFKILFQPGDEVMSRDKWGWPQWESRKKRVAFFLNQDDDFVLNYDLISLEEVEFYISRRVERRQYMKILPVLYQIYRQRLGEKAHEAEFVSHFARIEGVEETAVWNAVEWWKTKNLWKRPLAEDNDKAWRMIRKRLKKQ